MMDLRCRFALEFSLSSMTSQVKILTLFGARADQAPNPNEGNMP
jgi:hypothetical protein